MQADFHFVAALYLSFDDFVGQHIFYAVHDQPFQRTGAKLRVKAFFCQISRRFIRSGHFDFQLFFHPVGQFFQDQFHNVLNLFRLQSFKGHNIVHPV